MDEEALEELLSRPEPADVAALRALEGDILVLGVSGKMGPSLARLARRASDEAGVRRRILGAARFGDGSMRGELERHGVETIVCDALDRDALERLPDVANVVYMVGQKFGTTDDESRTWAINVVAPALAAERFQQSRIVAFSTGNVYPLTPVASGGPTEGDPTGPVGTYAVTALGRERVLEYYAKRYGTKMAILRLNYAIEPRYGVLRDLADRIAKHEQVDVGMGHVNVIWQRDANAIALRALAHASSPPLVLNVTGPETLAVRDIGKRLARRLGVEPRFGGRASGTALLSNASQCAELFGPPPTSLDTMVELVGDWVKAGRRSLGKPTHFEEREGQF
jgi:nucleoside-diphosphate-sugar epimerase